MYSRLLGQPVRQIAYVVEDVRRAAARHSALYGSGPFLVGKLPALPTIHRGQEQIMDVTAAFGQWGGVQVEFLQQNNDGPSVLRELLVEGRTKLDIHHLAFLLDDVESVVSGFKEAGYTEAARIFTGSEDIVYIDMLEEEGCFLELASAGLMSGLFNLVAQMAEGFDGQEPVREWDFNPST